MSDWISVEDELPKVFFDKFLVKKSNGEIFTAFFHHDKNSWRAFYGTKPSYWGDVYTNELLYEITHWMPIPL